MNLAFGHNKSEKL